MIKTSIIYTVGLGLLILTCNCSTDKKPRTEFENQLFELEERGWKSHAISHFYDGIKYKAVQVPIQYYVLKNEGSKDIKKVDSICKSMKNERVLEVTFEQEDSDDLLKSKYTKRDYEASVKYMAFGMQDDFQVVTKSGDTIHCSGLTFERNFKVAPFKRVLLYFGGIPEGEDTVLLYKDQMFGNGLMKFDFGPKPIKP